MSPSGKSKIIFNGNRLSYVSQDAVHIPPVLARLYGNKVTSLDLSYNRICTLDGLQNFQRLRELMLDNNFLDDNLVFPSIPTLHTLSLNNNKISHLEYFLKKVKKSLPNIKYLSILGNAACPSQISYIDKDEEDYQRYRYFVLYLLPNLEFLDSNVVSYEERCEGKQRGMYMRVARPTKITIENNENKNKKKDKYSPLPMFPNKTHQGLYGKVCTNITGNTQRAIDS